MHLKFSFPFVVTQASEAAISFGFSFNLHVSTTLITMHMIHHAVDKGFSLPKESLDLSGYQQKRLHNRKLQKFTQSAAA